MKAKEIAKELVVAFSAMKISGDEESFKVKYAECLGLIVHKELYQKKDIRNVSTDDGMLSIIKEQRNRWRSVCFHANKLTGDFFRVEAFDECFQLVFPEISEWYQSNIH